MTAQKLQSGFFLSFIYFISPIIFKTLVTFCSSSSGIVNLYDAPTALSSADPKPLKDIDNLTTRINNLSFSSDGQLLFYSSNEKKNALKVLHTPSLHTYSNWPNPGTALYR
jgi:U3 small nucleolar RNA-associated protein 18